MWRRSVVSLPVFLPGEGPVTYQAVPSGVELDQGKSWEREVRNGRSKGIHWRWGKGGESLQQCSCGELGLRLGFWIWRSWGTGGHLRLACFPGQCCLCLYRECLLDLETGTEHWLGGKRFEVEDLWNSPETRWGTTATVFPPCSGEDEAGGLNLQKWKERWRSTVSLPASLAEACFLSPSHIELAGEAIWIQENVSKHLLYFQKHSRGPMIFQMVFKAWMYQIAKKEAGNPGRVCYSNTIKVIWFGSHEFPRRWRGKKEFMIAC